MSRFKTPDSFFLKLRRAKEHRAAVARICDQHLEVRRRDHFLEAEISVETGEVFVLCPDLGFDDSIFLGAADCLSNVRACLDHLVCQIADRRGVDATKQAFPIADRLDDFNDHIGKGALKGVPFEAISIIEGHQPYDRVTGARIDTHPLFVLRELNNTDKHRAVYLASPDVRDLELTVECREQAARLTAPGPFRPGERAALIGTLPIALQGSHVVSVKFRGVNRITFADFPVRGEVVTKVLTRIIDYVEKKMLPALTPFAADRP